MFSNLVPLAVAVAPTYTVSFTVKDLVKGTIKDAPGVLLSGASVSFNGQTLTSNASGVATFTNVAVGNGLRYSVSKDGYNQASGTANVLGNLSQTILLSPPTQTVTFIIKDAGGAPLSGALVDLWVQGTLWGQFWKIPSNASGEAILLHVPQIDGLEYIIKKDGYNDVISLLTGSANLAPQIIVLTAAGIPTYRVSFTVKDAANGLVSGASVSFKGQTLTSNASGVATFTVAAGTNLPYSATKTGFNNASGTVNVAADLEQNIVLSSTNLTLDRTDPVGTGLITAQGEVPANGEGKEKAFDNNANTHWQSTTGQSWIQFQFAGWAKYAVSSYTLTSSKEVEGRDPRDWKLYATNTPEVAYPTGYVELNSQSGVRFNLRGEKKAFSLTNNTTPYRAYRLVITANANVGSTSPKGSIQLAEFELFAPNPCATCRTEAEAESQLPIEPFALQLYPNPASREVTLDLSGFAGESSVGVQMMDMSGTLLVGRHVSLVDGLRQVTLPVSGLSEGLFIVRVQGSKTVQTAKLVITK